MVQQKIDILIYHSRDWQGGKLIEALQQELDQSVFLKDYKIELCVNFMESNKKSSV